MVELLAPVNLDPVLFEHALEVAPDLLAIEALERHVLSITIEHLSPWAAVSDAATSVPM